MNYGGLSDHDIGMFDMPGALAVGQPARQQPEYAESPMNFHQNSGQNRNRKIGANTSVSHSATSAIKRQTSYGGSQFAKPKMKIGSSVSK